MDIKLYGVKIITDIGEDALCYLICTHSLEIELRTSYGQEIEDEIEQEERGDNNKAVLCIYLALHISKWHHYFIIISCAPPLSFADSLLLKCHKMYYAANGLWFR